MSPPLPAHLSARELALLGDFLGVEVTDTGFAAMAVRDQTYASDHHLADNTIRAAWLGDRVLNLVLADRIERLRPPSPRWAGTVPQKGLQSREVAARVVLEAWPEEIRALLRLGNTWRGRTPDPSMWAAFAESLVAVAFREGGYGAAQRFVEQWWAEWGSVGGSPRLPAPGTDPKTSLNS